MIEISLQEYQRLIQLEAKVQALIGYAKHTSWSIDREVVCGMLGFNVNEVKDGADRKQDGEKYRGYDGELAE